MQLENRLTSAAAEARYGRPALKRGGSSHPGLLICIKPPRKPVTKEACQRNICFPSRAVTTGSSFNHPGKDLFPSGRYMMLTQYLSTVHCHLHQLSASGNNCPHAWHPSPLPRLHQPSCLSAAAQLTSLCSRQVGPAQFLLGWRDHCVLSLSTYDLVWSMRRHFHHYLHQHHLHPQEKSQAIIPD